MSKSIYTLSNENKEEKIKKLIWLIIFLVAGYLVYNHFTSRPLSEEEQELKILKKDFNAALSRYQQAVRMYGVSGMDISSDVEDVIKTVEKLKKDLIVLKNRLEEETVIKKSEQLEEKMNLFLSERRYR